MTDKEVENELNKIPEEDAQKITGIKNLSDEELTNLAGGMSETTKKVLKGIAITGGVGALTAMAAWLSHRAGYSSGAAAGYTAGHEAGLKEGEQIAKKAVKEARKDASVQGFHRGWQKAFADFVEGNNDATVCAAIFKMMMVLQQNSRKD